MAASDAAAMPFPNEETTPPVTNTNLVIGWPVPEIAILPERVRRSKRNACAAQCAAARCGPGATVGPDPLTDPSPRQPLPLQSLFHPLTGRIAADEFRTASIAGVFNVPATSARSGIMTCAGF